MKSNEIWKIYGTDYKRMTKELLEAAGLLSCIEAKAMSKAASGGGDPDAAALRIGIKPNLVVPSPADFGATTHPEIVAGIIEYLRERKITNVVIAEGSWVGDRTSEAYEYCGYRTLCETYGVPFIDTQKEGAHEVSCAGMNLMLTDVVDRIDFLINVPVLKGHCQTKVTCALKNLKGLLPNREKSRFHQMGLHKPIAHLQTGIRQDFIVVDHICGDLDFEEGGSPVVRNCVMAGTDPVLLDSYACYLMQYTPDDVPYIRMAEALGVGSTDLRSAVLHLCGPSGKWIDLNPCGSSCDPERPRSRKILDVAYRIEEVDSCSACYAALTAALCRLKEEHLLDRLDVPIGIGQGMQGRTGRLGVGRCTKDFDVSIAGCPPDSGLIYRELRKYIERSGKNEEIEDIQIPEI